MKKAILIASLLLVAGVALLVGHRVPEAQAAAQCHITRRCSTIDPCIYVRSQPWVCGTDCDLGPVNGADGCSVGLDPEHPGCLKATLYGPGCCAVPCKPPAQGCSPN